MFDTQIIFFRLLLVSLMACSCVYGYKLYQNKIPNGGSIPHPCKPNYIWQGVGHENVLGGGVRNPFGTAFKAAGAVSLSSIRELVVKTRFANPAKVVVDFYF